MLSPRWGLSTVFNVLASILLVHVGSTSFLSSTWRGVIVWLGILMAYIEIFSTLYTREVWHDSYILLNRNKDTNQLDLIFQGVHDLNRGRPTFVRRLIWPVKRSKVTHYLLTQPSSHPNINEILFINSKNPIIVNNTT